MLPLILPYMYFENDAVDVLGGGHLETFQMFGIPTWSSNWTSIQKTNANDGNAHAPDQKR